MTDGAFGRDGSVEAIAFGRLEAIATGRNKDATTMGTTPGAKQRFFVNKHGFIHYNPLFERGVSKTRFLRLQDFVLLKATMNCSG